MATENIYFVENVFAKFFVTTVVAACLALLLCGGEDVLDYGDLRSRYGVLTYQNGEKYEGYWRQDKVRSFVSSAEQQRHMSATVSFHGSCF